MKKIQIGLIFSIGHAEYEVLYVVKNRETNEDMAVFCNVKDSQEKWVLPVSRIHQVSAPTCADVLSEDHHYLFAIRDYLKQHGISTNSPLDSSVLDRKNGKHFTIEEHIKHLVHALFSNQRKWQEIEPRLPEVDKVLFNYNPEKLKNTSPKILENSIRALRCGNRRIKAQMESLSYNIRVLEQMEKEYGSIDAFITSEQPHVIVKKLTSPNSRFKLQMLGEALAYEYLRGVGIDAPKPDLHLRRFLSSSRMGKSHNYDEASVREVLDQVDQLSEETGLTKIYIDMLIWEFCSDGNGEVCTKNPKCAVCPIKQKCSFIQMCSNFSIR